MSIPHTHPSCPRGWLYDMLFRRKRCGVVVRSLGSSPTSISNVEEAPAESSSTKNEPVSLRKRSRKLKTKAFSMRNVTTALTSHTFDAAVVLSDALGPFKAPVSVAAHVKDVWQNARKTTSGARSLFLEVEAFREQVEAMVAIDSESMKSVPPYVVESLIRLEKELDDIEISLRHLIDDHVGARILHWKKRTSTLETVRGKFQSSKDSFMITCVFKSSALLLRPESKHVDEHIIKASRLG
ncbi:hypothetical protein SCHPADRAFT_936347 [Schizopora paradoxa]|uniref:Uncharacterized protein n=1 Tax=Schizopora paradoxa TaxID=27342 RepID=A0A0H2SME8_9AGAM|nr:hypothetical protein SCHPADRAFT_936347 [Schizopora paradoxa]